MRRFIAAALLALAVAATGLAQTPPLTREQEEAVRALVRDTLRRNPELLLEVLDALEERKREAAASSRARQIVERRAELERDPADPVHGNEAGDATLVAFSDYRCPYCKRMAEPLAALLAEDRGLRMVVKEIPILGPESLRAAKLALAAQRQGKHAPVHAALMAWRGAIDDDAVAALARAHGLDLALLRRDAESPAIASRIERNLALARSLGVEGTPTFVIGDRFIPGAIDPATLRQLIAEARAKR